MKTSPAARSKLCRPVAPSLPCELHLRWTGCRRRQRQSARRLLPRCASRNPPGVAQTKAGWVCESTNPGNTTLPAQSISRMRLRFFLTQGSRSASFVLPTETIFPPRQSTAPSSMMPMSPSAAPRRGPETLPADSVSNCRILTSRSAWLVFFLFNSHSRFATPGRQAPDNRPLLE